MKSRPRSSAWWHHSCYVTLTPPLLTNTHTRGCTRTRTHTTCSHLNSIPCPVQTYGWKYDVNMENIWKYEIVPPDLATTGHPLALALHLKVYKIVPCTSQDQTPKMLRFTCIPISIHVQKILKLKLQNVHFSVTKYAVIYMQSFTIIKSKTIILFLKPQWLTDGPHSETFSVAMV